jgi:nicotinate-nucleotide adenylyltransferase
MRIGVCGGTFDPFHRGHLEPILAARKTLGWERILYVPAATQPFKSEQPSASGYHRFAMAQLATLHHDDIWVTPMELERRGISYTVDTLEVLHHRYPSAAFDWVIGDDNVAAFDQWKSPERLLQLARFVVLTRTGAEDDPRFTYAMNDVVAVSSTEIRRRVRSGEPIDAFVDPLVSRYIHHNGLYKEDQT